jgi:hypothetical protein
VRAADAGQRDRVAALLDELGVGQPLLAVSDHVARLGVVQGVLADRVVDRAVTETGRRRIRAELRGRLWAEERDIGVPEVLAAADDGRWLLSRRVHPAAAGGRQWVGEAVAVAIRIAPLPAPPGEPWQPPARGAAARALGSTGAAGRLLRHGVRLGELRAVRTAEWAGVRAGPRRRDLLTLWATTPDTDDRAVVADTVLERTTGWEGPDVGLLWHAVALEQLVARITRPDRGDGLELPFARARLAEARRLAAGLGSPL